MSDYYSVLGLKKDADDTDIKKAYRKKAQEYHPDRNPENPEAEKKFKEVQEAYETLSDKQKRGFYDQYGKTGPQGGFPGGGAAGFDFSQFGGFADIFENFFHGAESQTPRKPGPVHGGNIQAEIQIKFEEAIFGTVKHLEITKPETCDKCEGSGSEPGTSIKKCGECDGEGFVQTRRQTMLGQITSRHVCPQCHGAGEVPEKI